MVSLEYLPYYYKVSNHIWQLYALGVEKFFCMLKFDLYECHMIKNNFLKYTPPPPVIAVQEKLLATQPYNYVHPPGGWIYYFCFFRRPMSGVRRPMSGVTHGFRSFKGKVLELLSPNLVCRLIGSVACLGLLLAVVPLLLTE